MRVYSISYDISQHSRVSYDEIEETIKKNCSDSCKYATTTWIVKYSGYAKSLSQKLMDLGFGKDDRLLVIEVVNNKQGWLSKRQWETINSFF